LLWAIARQALHFCGINVITAWKKIQSTWKILIFVANIVLEDIAIVAKSQQDCLFSIEVQRLKQPSSEIIEVLHNIKTNTPAVKKKEIIISLSYYLTVGKQTCIWPYLVKRATTNLCITEPIALNKHSFELFIWKSVVTVAKPQKLHFSNKLCLAKTSRLLSYLAL